MANCLDCKMCVTVCERDPDDWFCDDDMTALCSMTKDSWRKIAERCRPYQLSERCGVPYWCPNGGTVIPKESNMVDMA